MTNHQEFGGRAVSVDDAAANYHATHVGGTIAASGVVARAKGMAPRANIDSYDWNADDAEMMNAAASFPDEAGNIYLSNHSYGILAGWFYAHWTNPWTRKSGYHWWGDITAVTSDQYFGQYGYGPRQWDEIVHDARTSCRSRQRETSGMTIRRRGMLCITRPTAVKHIQSCCASIGRWHLQKRVRYHSVLW